MNPRVFREYDIRGHGDADFPDERALDQCVGRPEEADDRPRAARGVGLAAAHRREERVA